LEDVVHDQYYVTWCASRTRPRNKIEWQERWKRIETRKDGKANSITSVQSDSLIRIWHFNKGGQWDRIYSIEWKSSTLSAHGGWRGAKTWLYEVWDIIRKLTPVECERLQWLPNNYTEGISKTQRYKCLWNAFNVDVVAHILRNLPWKREA
jgi:DNA (cytosine-5)-methyltransferase 3A